jgi:hypothetical protein
LRSNLPRDQADLPFFKRVVAVCPTFFGRESRPTKRAGKVPARECRVIAQF